MPFAMFFSGGQAVHYSSDFAANGYYGASHGCVNVRDYDGVAWLFDQVAHRRHRSSSTGRDASPQVRCATVGPQRRRRVSRLAG